MSPEKLLSVFVVNVLVTHLQLCGVDGQKLVALFSKHSFQGFQLDVSISQCTNLSPRIAGKVSSIDTNGLCARLFDGMNCTGNSIEVQATSACHKFLKAWDFDKKAVSVNHCRDPCSTEVTGSVPNGTFKIQIYRKPYFKGLNKTIDVSGCTRLPWGSNIRSVNTSGYCLQMYLRPDCNSGLGRNIELRENTPNHEELNYWKMKRARSVSHCSFKCTHASQPSLSTLGMDEVVLYSEPIYTGNSTKIKLKDLECHNISPDWEAKARSVQIGNNSCVILFVQRGCKGEYLDLEEAAWDLENYHFEYNARSIRSCVMNDKPRIEEESSSAVVSLSTMIIFLIIVVILSILFALYMRKRYYNLYLRELDKLSDKEVEEFMSGLEMDTDMESTELLKESSSKTSKRSNDYPVEMLALNKPYNKSYEVARDKIKFDSGAPLGLGEFGMVFKGSLEIDEMGKLHNKTIAIKTAKLTTGLNGLRSLMKEVKVMLHTGNHHNIVHLLGCCTENLQQGEILVLLEFCSHGSLQSYLEENRSSFVNLVISGKLGERDTTQISTNSTRNYGSIDSVEISSTFDIYQLLKWCFGIARGMEFLANANIIHSDLAARNVLLDDNLGAKISDFGLSRQLYNYSQYMKKDLIEPLPWRWMALESLKSLEFSTKSDVWSFGILCWEIFTLGEKPFTKFSWNETFISSLEIGMRPTKPKYSTDEFYNLMYQCWEEDSRSRPSFTEIAHVIQEMMLNRDTISDFGTPQ